MTVASQPPPAPRPVTRLTEVVGFSAFFFTLFGGIWALVGTLLTVAFTAVGGPLWDDWLLDLNAARARAEVLEVVPTSTRINRARVMEVRFRFEDSAGNPHEGHGGTTSHALLAAAERKELLMVEYDPGQPSRHRLVGERASVFGWFILLPLGFAVVGWGLLVWAVRTGLRRRFIYVHGPAVRATVTGVKATNTRVNRRSVFNVTVRFLGPRGMQNATYASLLPPEVEAQVWVIHHPEDPSQVVGA